MIYVKLALWLALGSTIAYGGYHVADLKGKAALASLQEAWDADRAAIQKTTAAAIAQSTKERDDALQANEGITSDLTTQLSSIRELNSTLAARLRIATRVAADSGAVPKAGGGQSTIATPLDIGDGQIDDAIADALTECASNRANQVALQKEIISQL